MRTRIFLGCALVVAIVASCAKIDEQDLSVPSPANGGQKTLKFLTEKGEMSKTALGSAGAVSWSDGDQISVFGEGANNLFTLTSIESDGSAKFSGSASGSPLYALYPYNADAAISADGVITTVLPADQIGVKDSFAPGLNISVGSTTEDEFLMRNVCGLVAFSITRTDITSVTLSSNGKEFLTGNLEITLDGSGIPSYNVTKGSRYVTIHPEGSTFEAGTYYAVVLPNTYVGGWRMTFTTSAQAGTVKTSADASVQRSHILDVHSPDAALNLSDVIALGVGETANCYVAGSAGRRYKMPVTVMGNGYTTAPDYTSFNNGISPGLTPTPLSPEAAQLLWQTKPGLLEDVTYADGYVFFTLNGEVGGELLPGNASIAVYGGPHCTGDLLWSWHIWVTDADLDNNLQTWAANPSYTQYSHYASSDLMDRNLGALSDEPWGLTNDHSASGLEYQWGRKDPFVGADDTAWNSTAWMVTYDAAGAEIPRDMSSAKYSSDVEWGLVAVLQNPEYNATDNPRACPSPTLTAKYPMRFVKVGNGMWARPNMNDLWGLPPYDVKTNYIGHKTIYDPCPPGYRVMQPYAMSGVFADYPNGGKFETIGNHGNILNVDTYATDRGYKIKYNDSDYSWFPCNGSIKNDTALLYRVGSYGYLWTCKGSPTNHNGVNCYFDSANFYSVNNGTRSGFGHGVRCQKID